MVKNERKCTWMNVKPALLILSALLFLTLIFFVKTTTVMAADDVCQIGTIKYTTLDDAITDANKATSAVTITMLKDVKINTKLIINNVNNKKITITSTDETSPNKVTFDAAASFSVSTDFTLNQLILSGGDKPESVGRTTAAITITGGTTTVQGTGYDQDYNNYSIIENFGKSDTICAGGVFNVSGDNTVLNLKSGSIKNCIANSDANETGYDAKNGGAVLYMNGGTVLLSDMYIFYCGVGDGADFTPGICSGPVCVKKGTFKMTGGSINNCKGVCGGAISLWSGATADISGGVFNSNQAAKDGGAVYAASGSTLNISGSVWIKENVCSGANEGASAIAYREGAKISIKGSPVIAGNRTDCLDTGKSAAICCADAYDPVTFKAEDADGSITISGSPTIRNNTCGSQENGSPADLAVYSAATLTVGNMDAKLATVGICSPLDESLLKNGSQFAAALSGTAAETTNLQAFFCDKNPVNHEALVGSAGEGSDVIWKKTPYVCKIVTNNAATVYLTLQDALDAVPNEGSATIEMLVENYEIKTQQNVGSNEGERNITITTASENAADGYSYTGKSGTKAALTRTATCTALYLNNRTTLTLTNIELKDNAQRTPTVTDMCRLIMADGESDARVTVNMSSGAVVTGGDNGNGNMLGYNTTGAGLYLKFTTLNMTGDAVISGCKGDSGSAIYAIGSTVNMSGTSTITDCTSYELGAVTLATDTAISTEPSSFTMSENSKITNNTGTLARASAVYFYGDSAKHVFTMEGNAEISGNTVNKTRTNDPKYAATVSAGCAAVDITMSGNAVIKNNVVKNPDAQSSGGISLSMGCSLTMSDYSSITGNGTQSAGDTDANSTSGGVNVLPGESSYSDGTITISGNVNITGNTCLNGSQDADLTIANNNMLKVGDLGNGASVGVYSVNASLIGEGNSFAAASSGIASATGNLKALFNDKTSTLVGIAGDNAAVRWGKIPACKIVADGVAVPYSTLKEAIDTIGEGATATIEMLTARYDITAEQIIDSKKTITITTASKDAKDGYPYYGAAGTNAVLRRTADCSALHVKEGSSLTLANITLKDTLERKASSADPESMIWAEGNSNLFAVVYMKAGAVITGGNNGTSFYSIGAGVNLKYGKLTMDDNAKISECTGKDGSAIYADNGTVSMCGVSAITNNISTSGGAVYITNDGSLSMIDSAAITGNKNIGADTQAGGVSVNNGSIVSLSGAVKITGNTCSDGTKNADLTLPNNATTLKVNELSENASVGIYSSGGSTDNILQNGAQFAAVTAKYATQVDNLDIFFNNATAVRGSAGVGQAVVWGTGELTVSNTTAGDGADTTKPFGFTLKGLQEDGLSYTGYIYKISDPGKSLRSYTFNSSSQAFALANDEFMRIQELPVGSSLTVTETDAEASGGSTSVYKGSIKNGTDSKTEFTISDLAAVTPQDGLACGASSLSVSNTRNSVVLTSGTEADKSSVYGITAEKKFNVTGVDSAYTAVWCNKDGSTKDAPKSAGTFKPGNVTSGQSDLTLTPTAGAGTYYFKVSDGGLSSNVMIYTITQIPVTITGLGAADKAYDGSTAAIVTGTSSLNGILSGDNVSVTNGIASFADKNAGTNKAVSYSGYSLAGTDAANYILTAQPAPVTASISTVSITVTPDSGQYKKIGNAEPSFTYTSSGAVGKEEPSFKGALSRDAGETIGDYAILIGSLALTDNGSSFTAANYTLQFTSGVTFEIGKGDVSETKLFADFGIIKKDADNQAPIEATFTLSGTDRKNSRVNITGTTDAASGQATFSNVPVGLLSDGTRQPYTLTETGADGYITAGPWDVLADTDQDGNEIISIKLHSAPDTDYQLITGKKGPDGYLISSTQTLLTIKKIDNQAKPLTGAIMKIEGDFADGTNEKSISNNEANALKGVFISGNKYTLTETVRPEGYEGFYDKIIFHLDNTGKALIDSNSDLSDGQAAAAVSPDGTVISLRNLSYTGSVTLTKKDFEDNTVLLKGVHYCLYKEKVSGTQDVTKDTKITVNGSADFTTDSNGQITIIDLSEGTYYFVEQSTITGYEPDPEVQKPFAIDDTDNAHDHAVSVTYTNKKLLDITITANWIDAEDAYAMRPDSTAFTLYADGVRVTPQPAALASPVKAGNTWTYTLTGLQKYKTGTGDMIVYTVKEEPVTNYKANSDTVVVKNGTASFTNTLSLETAIATVTDYSENTSEKTLSGAGYILVRKNADGTLSYFTGNDTATGMALWGSKSAEAKLLTAGTDGTASVSGLYSGSYYFLQTKAPSGYLINSTPITFEVTTAGSKTISTTQANKMITSSFGSTVKGAMTGDGSGILVWLLIILAAFAAGGYALYGRRKH